MYLAVISLMGGIKLLGPESNISSHVFKLQIKNLSRFSGDNSLQTILILKLNWCFCNPYDSALLNFLLKHRPSPCWPLQPADSPYVLICILVFIAYVYVSSTVFNNKKPFKNEHFVPIFYVAQQWFANKLVNCYCRRQRRTRSFCHQKLMVL